MSGKYYQAEVDYDGQHGPLVRFHAGDVTLAVYLADETGVLVMADGSTAGIEVSGAWHAFREGVKILVEDRKWAMIG